MRQLYDPDQYLTGRARFTPAVLVSGEPAESIRAAIGFGFDVALHVTEALEPSEAELALLRGTVCDEMLEVYPELCPRAFEGKRTP